MTEAVLAVLVAAGAICALLWMGGGILQLLEKIEDLRACRRRRETIATIKLYRMVARRVPGELPPTEYDRAVRYVIQKYHMADRNGGIDMHQQDPEYISMLVAEAVGQDRLSRGTLAIAVADREAIRNQMEGERTA